MSHTFEAFSGFTRIHYNSDLSGRVTIVQQGQDGKPIREVEIPGADLLAFVAHHVRNNKITALHKQTNEAILGLDKPPD